MTDDAMKPKVRQLRIASTYDDVAAACEMVADSARRAGLDEETVQHCYLVVDEACTNVIEHGYHANGRDGVIEVTCRTETNQFKIIVSDDAPAFDPLSVPDPVVGRGVEALEPGGWGVFFIKRLMDSVSYEFSEGQNRLVMAKKIVTPAALTSPEQIVVEPVSDQVWMFSPQGKLHGERAEYLQAVLGHHFSQSHKLIIMHMAEVDYVSSVGLKVLLSAWQRARDLKGDVVLAALRPRVREVLEIIGLDLVFQIADTPQQALELLTQRRK